ncbi:ectonucleotide pyrophosphatase/phosphodiesterase family member 3-like [Impatiens glandulifera]|uniref:ectonucleotide pyrophosphatase/phosphodiesterase family member 3-like n=1 Tax=Impatiens glandulifera TaxID=253017 RepID=UPI001FB08B4B|nr:ectonucleotide pyrophosphatase/phosphodiesterase family member 3-like [Impatiens glandulifera]
MGSTSLLSLPLNNNNRSKPPAVTIIFISLILSVAGAFSFLLFSSSSSSSSIHTHSKLARPLTKLTHPVVILISSDGFRFGYQYKTSTPNIHRLINNGTEAIQGLIPVFPTLTFPNHYSIVTGLYPSFHGIINNHFIDPQNGDTFTMASHESKWWLGQPLWETVTNHGLKAATYFWPGSEVKKGSWNCPKNFCMPYNGSVPFEDRVDTVLQYFDLPSKEIPVFMTLYFEDPDHQGHQVGPDDPLITESVARIDSLIGRLIDGLEKRGVFEEVTVIMVGDHGMVGTCDKKLIFLQDLAKWIQIPQDWIHSYSPVLAIRPSTGHDPSDVVAKMNEGLRSGQVNNGKYLKMYLKEDLPSRLQYSASERIPPIIGLVDEGFKVETKNTKKQECGGAHGYDNAFFSMRTIFIAHGPQIAKGRKVESFENVEIYNLVTSILNIEGAPNNGTESFPNSILLPT